MTPEEVAALFPPPSQGRLARLWRRVVAWVLGDSGSEVGG